MEPEKPLKWGKLSIGSLCSHGNIQYTVDHYCPTVSL